MKGKLTNGVSSQCPSHYLGTWYIPHYYHWCTLWLRVVDCRFKWTRPFRRKTKSGFCACAVIFQTQSTSVFSTVPEGFSISANLLSSGRKKYFWYYYAVLCVSCSQVPATCPFTDPCRAINLTSKGRIITGFVLKFCVAFLVVWSTVHHLYIRWIRHCPYIPVNGTGDYLMECYW
jgi:hypothetical protein